jgi:hypothetical protein
MDNLNLEQIEKIKTTYFHYGSEFWIWKKCNACREQFALENHSQKQIELIFCKKSKVNEYRGSEGVEIKWYHKSCLVRWNDVVEKISTQLKKNHV